MKAVVLVGGEGTRLRPLTETIPKPLLPFMNRAFLDHLLDHLAAHGVDHVLLSSPYLEDRFRRYLEGRRGTPAVTWITEAQPLGTAGAIAGAREYLQGTFLAVNGDVLTDLDLTRLVRFHRERGAVATIALHRVADARPFGLVDTDDDGRVRAFREKPRERIPGAINAGTYVLEPEALGEVPPGVPVSIERETYPRLIAGGAPVYALAGEAYWRDLGTPAAYLQAHVDALDGLVGGRRYPRPYRDDGARIDAQAAVGEHVVIGAGASVAGGAAVDRSVLHEGVTVERGAVVHGSILGPQVSVGEGAEVRDSVLAEGAGVDAGARLTAAKLAPGAVASGGSGDAAEAVGSGGP